MALERGPLLADETQTGHAWCRAHSDLVDAWLAELLADAVGAVETSGVALVAVGGYGRSELCPHSDIDVMLVHDARSDVRALADRVWYPIWDEDLHLGHSVCTVSEAVKLAGDDLDTATALLSARHVAGDRDLSAKLAAAGRDQWQRRSKRWLGQLAARVDERHAGAGEVAFLLEPDLKEGRGGLRDVHALHWAEEAQRTLLDLDAASLDAAYAVLLDARVELQRITGRPTNVLSLQEQPAVAEALGDRNHDALMARVAAAARSIAWTQDDTWRRIDAGLKGPLGRIATRARPLGTGVVLRDGEVVIEADADIADDPAVALRVAAAAAGRGAVIERRSLERLAAKAPSMPDPWPDEARALLIELLRRGQGAIRVVEALDQRGVWTRILPEWAPVQSRPQHNAYHRYTVDRHLLETAARAAELADTVRRPDLLVVGALLHDLGKGYPGDHTEAGMELAEKLGARMGFPPDDVATLTAMVEHHLLLPDVATRRDLDEPATIANVVDAVGSVERLELLAALTEADSRATGPAAWGPWKDGLVTQLVERVTHVLEGGTLAELPAESFPTSDQLARLAAGTQHLDGHDDVLTVVTRDRPGVFSRVAGVLALHGLDVLSAAAYSSDRGALSEFRVVDPFRAETPWARVIGDLELALDGRLALHARVAERARTYGRTRPSDGPVTATVSFDAGASPDATVIDVHARDGVGVLYRITRALAELDLDIRSARVQTLGSRVVDAFYVRDRTGAKVSDRHDLAEIERAILYSLSE